MASTNNCNSCWKDVTQLSVRAYTKNHCACICGAAERMGLTTQALCVQHSSTTSTRLLLLLNTRCDRCRTHSFIHSRNERPSNTVSSSPTSAMWNCRIMAASPTTSLRLLTLAAAKASSMRAWPHPAQLSRQRFEFSNCLSCRAKPGFGATCCGGVGGVGVCSKQVVVFKRQGKAA